MKLRSFFQARKKASHPAKFSLRNILAVIQSYFRKSLGGITVPQHIYEQIIWRRVRVMKQSPNCWNSGHCEICGCEILGKTMEDRGCSLQDYPELHRVPCYPDMMSKQDWKDYKKFKKIKLFN